MPYYVFTKQSRRFVVTYLQQYLREENAHWTGEGWVTMPAVRVFDLPDYRERVVPAVVISNAAGSSSELSFDQDLGPWVDNIGSYGDVGATYQVFGGFSSFTIQISCGAYEEELQQNLSDVVGMYLLLGKHSAFMQARTLLLDEIRFLGSMVVTGEPDQGRVFEGRLSTRVSADWRMIYPVEVIRRVNLDLELTEEVI